MIISSVLYLISHTDINGIKYMRGFLQSRMHKYDFSSDNTIVNDLVHNLSGTVLSKKSANEIIVDFLHSSFVEHAKWSDFEYKNNKIKNYSLLLIKNRFADSDKLNILNSALQATIYSEFNSKFSNNDKKLIKSLEILLIFFSVELRHLQIIHEEHIKTILILSEKKIIEKAHKIHSFSISDLLNDANLIIQDMADDRNENCKKCHVYSAGEFQNILNTLNMISAFRSFDNEEYVKLSHLLDLFNAFKRPSCFSFGFALEIINYCTEEVYVMAHDLYYISLLNILFENAMEAGATNFTILIDHDQNNLVIVFTNNGLIMSQDELLNCFKIFNSTKNEKHYGLSLHYIKSESIKRNIAFSVLPSEFGAKFILKTALQKSISK